MASAATRGSGAAVMGRPTTRWVASACKAEAGVAARGLIVQGGARRADARGDDQEVGAAGGLGQGAHLRRLVGLETTPSMPASSA